MFFNGTLTDDTRLFLNNPLGLNHSYTMDLHFYDFIILFLSTELSFTWLFYSYALIKDDIIATWIPPFRDIAELTLENDSKASSSESTSYWLSNNQDPVHLPCM